MDCMCIHVFIFSQVVPKKGIKNLVIVSFAWRQTLCLYMSHVRRENLLFFLLFVCCCFFFCCFCIFLFFYFIFFFFLFFFWLRGVGWVRWGLPYVNNKGTQIRLIFMAEHIVLSRTCSQTSKGKFSHDVANTINTVWLNICNYIIWEKEFRFILYFSYNSLLK